MMTTICCLFDRSFNCIFFIFSKNERYKINSIIYSDMIDELKLKHINEDIDLCCLVFKIKWAKLPQW